MKRKTSIAIAIILAVCVLMTQAVALTAFAETPEAPMIIVSNPTAAPGDTVDVTITMSGNPGFVSANLNVNYDSNVLKLKEVKDGGLLGGVTHSDNLETSPYGLCWANDTVRENITVNGVLATLTFEVAADAEAGTSAITLEQDILNFDMDDVVFNLVSGGVQVEAVKPSDPTEPTKPTEEPTKPTDDPTKPTDEPTEGPTKPTDEPTKPTDAPTDPSEKPTAAPTQPTTKTTTGGGTTSTVNSTPKTAAGVVKTGDSTLVFLLVAVMVGGFVSAYMFSVSRKRKASK